jgi:predicted flap endonuclease-1-like 5' DNA nuclease
MFKEWGFLLGEIWVLLLIAALVGLVAGWLVWGRGEQSVAAAVGGVDPQETDRLRAALAECQRAGRDHATRVAALEAQLKAADARADRLAAQAAPHVEAPDQAPDQAFKETSEQAVAVAPADTATSAVAGGVRPQGLAAARAGGADDLKLIKGIGPKLEQMCHGLGYYHFDQIAAWSAEEIAWVDENLEGFKGRVTRDDWVAQARDLAAGKPPRAMASKPLGL